MNTSQGSLGSDGGHGHPRAAAAVSPELDRAWMPFDTNFDSDEVWMRRRRHRVEAIRAVRRSDDHVRALEIRGHGHCAYLHMPLEPNTIRQGVEAGMGKVCTEVEASFGFNMRRGPVP